jgi:hypothetical protein
MMTLPARRAALTAVFSIGCMEFPGLVIAAA